MLRLYNSYTKRKEVFRPFKDKAVTMYNCGPTVYDFVHIGNLRSFLFADILRRYLEYRKYKVKQVMNITDVGHMTTDADQGEDKMILAMRREGKSVSDIARFYEGAFFEDVKILGVKPAFKYPRATEHVSEMIKLIKKLLKRKHAYKVLEDNAPRPSLKLRGGEGGVMPGYSIYYDLSTFKKYGKLSGNKIEDLIPGARAEVIHEKRNPYDFALWIYKPEHVLQWETPWGRGYPGWHLECSAMSMKYLGATLDIHTGGEDNKFPHHECEIAQSEGATGKQFARFWLHVKHLLVDGKKMSKSLGNFYTLKNLLDRGFTPRVIRYILVSTHYRETLNFTFGGLKSAQAALMKVDELVERLRNPSQPPQNPRGGENSNSPLKVRGNGGVMKFIKKARQDFISALDDDLNVPKTLAVLFSFVRRVNRKFTVHSSQFTAAKCDGVLKFLQEIDSVLGLGLGTVKKSVIPDGVMKLAEEREVK